jgi:hypothetical protein
VKKHGLSAGERLGILQNRMAFLGGEKKHDELTETVLNGFLRERP